MLEKLGRLNKWLAGLCGLRNPTSLMWIWDKDIFCITVSSWIFLPLTFIPHSMVKQTWMSIKTWTFISSWGLEGPRALTSILKDSTKTLMKLLSGNLQHLLNSFSCLSLSIWAHGWMDLWQLDGYQHVFINLDNFLTDVGCLLFETASGKFMCVSGR